MILSPVAWNSCLMRGRSRDSGFWMSELSFADQKGVGPGLRRIRLSGPTPVTGGEHFNYFGPRLPDPPAARSSARAPARMPVRPILPSLQAYS